MGIWDAAEEPEYGPVEPRGSGRGNFAAGTPEDVAALYTWANLQGAPYRDFSASRRRYREQVRAQAADDPDKGRVAKDARPAHLGSGPAPASLQERQRGGSAIRWAAKERDWESSSRSLGRERSVERARPETTQAPRNQGSFEPLSTELLSGIDQPEPAGVSQREQEVPRPTVDWAADGELASLGSDPLYRSRAELWETERWERAEPRAAEAEASITRMLRSMEREPRATSGSTRLLERELLEDEPEFQGPAWLYTGKPELPAAHGTENKVSTVPVPDERRVMTVSRWSALRDLVATEWAVPRETRSTIPAGGRAPLLVLFSLAGGVGKTSLLAMLGRALSASGERVLLGDAAPYSLLPFYFGGSELRPGEMRAFAPPAGSAESPVFLANYELSHVGGDAHAQGHVVGEILRDGAECHRILVDLPRDAEWLLRRLATLQPTVLVPLVPDMSAVVSLEKVERYFDRFADADGNPVLPFYVLSQFDATLDLHMDVCELLRGRLGERLLSFPIRRSAAVSEALAEGLTVADYAPESPVARDYFDVTAWLRTVSPPAAPSARSGRG